MTIRLYPSWIDGFGRARYPNRSRALQFAIDLLVERERRSRLARELAKLNRADEQRLAEEGIGDLELIS